MDQLTQFRNAVGIVVLALVGSWFIPQPAHASDNYRPAKLVVSDESGEYIGAIQWQSYDLPIQVVEKKNTRQAFVQLNGTLKSTDESLVLSKGRQSIPLTPLPDGSGSTFSITVPLQGKVSILNFETIDPYGRIQTEKIALIFPGWDRFRLPVTKGVNYRRLLTSAGLGVSELHYQEAGVIDMNELGLTGKFNLSYRLVPDEWELGGNAFATILPVTLSIPSGEASARWYGLNGRVAYHLPLHFIKNTNLWVMTGWYIWGMLVGNSPSGSYGVAYLGGPELFLTARITPPAKRASFVYLKYASISNGLQIFSTTNRELAIGGGHEITKPGKKHPMAMTLDIADAKFADTDHQIHLFSLSLGVSVGL